MRRYLVKCRYRRESRTAPETFLCEADEPAHAIEQAQDLHPNTTDYDVYELVPVDPDHGDLSEAKARHLIGWLNLTIAEWEHTLPSMRTKLWDALNGVINPNQRRAP